MRDDFDLRMKILEDIETYSHYTSDDSTVAYHIALLQDCGYVDAEVQYDEISRMPKAVKVRRLTISGHERLEKLRAERTGTYYLTDEDKADRNRALDGQHESQIRLDQTLLYISSGGIALCGSIIVSSRWADFSNAGKCFFLFAMAIWCVTLIILGASFIVSNQAYGKYIDCIDCGRRKEGWKNRWSVIGNACNFLSVCTFLVAAVLFACAIWSFSFNNGGAVMQSDEDKKPLTESTAPAKPMPEPPPVRR